MPYTKVGKYIIKRKVGEGAFAEVRLCVHEDTGVEYAVKIFCRDAFSPGTFEREVRREVDIMKYLSHPNIVSVHTVLVTAKKMYIVMELVRGGELYDEIVTKHRVDENTSRKYFHQIVDAMVYCHSRGVVHRDLKPENVLLDGHGTIKITDFGMSRMKENIDPEHRSRLLLHTQCGTPKYMAPEVIRQKPGGYDGEKLDAWECGMILYALLAGHLPFPGDDDDEVFRCILRGKVHYPEHFSAGAKDLLSKLLEKDPVKRWGLAHVRKHPWFVIDYAGDLVKERQQRRTRLIQKAASSRGSRLSAAEPSNMHETRQSLTSVPGGDRRRVMLVPHLPVKADTNFKDNARDGHVRQRSPSRSRSRTRTTRASRARDRSRSRTGGTSRASRQPRSRSRTRGSASRGQRRSRSNVGERLEGGELLLSGGNDNLKVSPKRKQIRIPELSGDNPAAPDAEFREEVHKNTSTHSPVQTPKETGASRSLASPRKKKSVHPEESLTSSAPTDENEKRAERQEGHGLPPPLPLNLHSKDSERTQPDSPISFRERLLSPFSNRHNHIEDDSPSSFRDRLFNPFGAMFRTVKSGASSSAANANATEAASSSSYAQPATGKDKADLYDTLSPVTPATTSAVGHAVNNGDFSVTLNAGESSNKHFGDTCADRNVGNSRRSRTRRSGAHDGEESSSVNPTGFRRFTALLHKRG